MRFTRPRISYADITSTLALALVLGGTAAYAANTIRSPDIVDGQVKKRDLGAGSVTSAKVRDDSLKVTDLSANARAALKGAQGVQGPAGPAGAQGPAGSVQGVAAGGDLAGTYPAPSLGSSVVAAPELDVLPVVVARSSTLPFVSDPATFVNVAMNQESLDTTGTMHSTTSNSHQIVAPIRGLYAVSIQVRWLGGNFTAGGFRSIRTSNGLIASTQATVQSNSIQDVQSASGVLFLGAGDVVGLQAATPNPSFVDGTLTARFISPYCVAPQLVCAEVN